MTPALAKLKAGLTKNRTALAGLGVVVVAALAWRARSTSTTSTAAPSTGKASTVPAYYSTGGQSAGMSGAAYDSTGSDVYNALQPQLEDVAGAVQSLRDLMSQQTPIPVPAPAPEPTPTPAAAVTSWGSDRRNAIAGFYQSILGRAPELKGLNDWDRTGAPLETIWAGILGSQEAMGPR